MDNLLQASLWQQFGASLDMLDDALTLCPDDLWTAILWKDSEDPRYGTFWFIAYHATAWLDRFMSNAPDFRLPAPFVAGGLPEKPYTKSEVQSYLRQNRARWKAVIESLTDEKVKERSVFDWIDANYFQLQLSSLRHLQEHGAQLNFFLGQHGIEGMDWVPVARELDKS
jgi:hypothetical protein